MPKFSTYDGSSDPFDHIMHYRQLMTLDIGNDVLLVQSIPRQPTRNISTPANIKMQDNESLREFVKRFGQAVLQVEAYSMDAVLQIFKRSICPGTPFFRPPQQILVAGQTSRRGAERSAKLPDQPRPSDRKARRAKSPGTAIPHTPLHILREAPPMIRDLSNFRWPEPPRGGRRPEGIIVRSVPTIRSTTTLRRHAGASLLGEKLIRAGHLKQYLRSYAGGRDASRNHNSGTPTAPSAPKAIINYINGCPFDEEYDSKRKRQKLLRAASMLQAGPVTLNVQFLVVQDLSPFNVILGRTWLHYMKAIPSTYHQMHEKQGSARRIHHFLSLVVHLTNSKLLSPADKDPPTVDPLQAIQISEEGTYLTYISSLLTPEKTWNIQDALRQSHDVFAWAHSDMKGIHPSIISHKLNILPTARPVRQKVKRFHPNRQKIIRDEIDKLLEAGFIREVEYPDWLANVMVVPKKEGKWRVCVDYTNLNNACPKDSFLLPRIDQIVDSTTG
ncbi:hypothetical protein CK203_063051 [Vitis vinifera]|uniref:Transposon Ty3-I Gag-Pol polyprotein n=1 Tax=Vitis vinifera TaxID=29760 RepID=A0A438G5I2_VITVI|nr:hypothetical protein CK203_063051 [Vitis vinifera]